MSRHYLCYMHHPAHFHLYKNVIKNLKNKGHTVAVICQKKDVLSNLLEDANIAHHNFLPAGRKNNKIGMLSSLIKQDIRTLRFCLKNKPNLMFGTSAEICHVGSLLNIPSLYCNEDDLDVVPLLGTIVYPFATHILSPGVCNNQKWEKKSIKYESYHELAYLHPNNFTPQKDILEKFIKTDKPYFVLRFAKLNAHHDRGIRGINPNIADNIIRILKSYGDVYITSERELEPQFEKYRLKICPLDIHHIIAFADLYIGDSQTMAAEAGVLGTPFVRYNDFVGRIGYLAELEDKYNLGYGIKPSEPDKLFNTIKAILAKKDRKVLFGLRRKVMLSEKIDLAQFLTWFIEDYPLSVNTTRKNLYHKNKIL